MRVEMELSWITTMKKRLSTDDQPANPPLAPLVPPLGFAMVAPGVYRSGHPNHCNFAFLDGLHLKSIMYICLDTYRPHTYNWAQDRGLKIFHHRIDSYKQAHDPASDPSEQAMYAEAIQQILDRRNLPILIHCNKGKHRVSTLSALLRIIQGWDTLAVRAEWDKFLGEGAPPGKNMIWSPGLVFLNQHTNTDITTTTHTQHHHHHHHQLCLATPRGSDPPLDPRNSPSWTTPTQNPKTKNKVADGLARASEWEYVEQFPIHRIRVDPRWIPSWLPLESIQQQQ